MKKETIDLIKKYNKKLASCNVVIGISSLEDTSYRKYYYYAVKKEGENKNEKTKQKRNYHNPH